MRILRNRLPPRDVSGHAIDAERPYLLLGLGLLGLFGCVAMLIGTVAAQIAVPDHNWIADTISDLGAGKLEIVMDVTLYCFAGGLIATALAASHAHLGGVGWPLGILALAILAGLVIVVGARNEYGDNDNAGVVIHSYLVFGLGAFFLQAPLCMAAGIGREHPGIRRVLIGLGIAWGIVAPIFLLVPTSIDGLLERVLGVIACAIVATLSYVFFVWGRRAYRTGKP